MNGWSIPEPQLKLLRSKRYNRADFELIENLVVVLNDEKQGCYIRIVVPAGFVTDFASIPRFFWRILPPSGPWAVAAIVHDFLYNAEYGANCPRFLADAIFRALMEAMGVGMFKRFCIYYAVRLFGGRHGYHMK